ncbi:hypothetical protein AB205_0046960 [Aquarana catesbeiana]|uniref:Sulfotransferase n=1 Tax=Aquarana catesbeiana TaxID=8400 RepID=A0A2G9SJU4_AQUCT|nr:hypothetical protein AB205_0046960 [Aquarana catesbeiana]
MKPLADQWERVEKFQARPDDILIATYPKAGTTWIQEIVDSIMNDGELEKNMRAPTEIRSPFLELFPPPPVPSGIDVLNVTPSPRLVKTHLPYKLVPISFWEQKCKTIYFARNLKDNAVSCYFFDQMNKSQPDPGTWDEFVEKYLRGESTTWIQEIVDSIMNDGELEKNMRAPTEIRSPFLELFPPPPVPSGIDVLNVTPSPRLVKTHLPYKLVPISFWEQKCKTIYFARNLKDNAVSCYFFDQMNKSQPDPGTWDEFVEKYLRGESMCRQNIDL